MGLPSEEMYKSLSDQYAAHLEQLKSAEPPRGDRPPRPRGRWPGAPKGSGAGIVLRIATKKAPEPRRISKISVPALFYTIFFTSLPVTGVNRSSGITMAVIRRPNLSPTFTASPEATA